MLPAAVFVTAAVGILAATQFRQTERAFQVAAAETLNVQARILDGYLHVVASDLALLSGSSWLRALPAGLDDGQRTLLERQLITFAESRGLYDQVRFIDLHGREVVRINHHPEGAISVPRESLQDKSDRAYVTIGLELAAGEVFFSPLDLNVDNGAVDWPPKPTIRLVAPVFDLDGSRRGILVLNCFFAPVLADLRRAGEVVGTPMLLDRRGYWLLGPDPDDEWGFMWAQSLGKSLAHRDPGLWSRIADAGAGDFMTIDGVHAFTTLGYRRIQPIRRITGSVLQPMALPLGADNEEWKLVLFLPMAQVVDQTHMRTLAVVGFSLLCITTLLCITVARVQTPPGAPVHSRPSRGRSPAARPQTTPSQRDRWRQDRS